jgi:hypothetical protein
MRESSLRRPTRVGGSFFLVVTQHAQGDTAFGVADDFTIDDIAFIP